MLEACELNSVSEEDYLDLSRAGLGSCLLEGLPDWLVAYSARVVSVFSKCAFMLASMCVYIYLYFHDTWTLLSGEVH